ncbi:MAG TPA: hypothetical protein VMT58_05950, partial [Candidatus Binataceae bacterium]|nr:hypothetical protein [Candidatus Binataceae bacterium]
MPIIDIFSALAIAAVGGASLVFIGILIQWSLRKARPALPPEEHEPAEALAGGPPQKRPAPAAAPVRIGLGLRKTRENFLGRLRAALTG